MEAGGIMRQPRDRVPIEKRKGPQALKNSDI